MASPPPADSPAKAMTLAWVRRPTCEARSAAWKASPITYTPPWKYRTTWRDSIPSTVISAVGTPPSAAAVTVTSAGSGCAESNSFSSRRCSLTSLSVGKADCRRIASRVSRCSVLTGDLPSVGRCRPSGVHVRPVAEVEADRLHHRERRALREHVRGREHTGVLLDHWRSGCGGDVVEVALHRCPRVLAVLLEVGSRIDGFDRLPRVVGDVRDVLLMQRHVVPRAEPAVVTADVMLPRVRERVRRCLDVAGDVLAQVRVVDRRPARIDDVDQHQRVVVGQVDEDVVG